MMLQGVSYPGMPTGQQRGTLSASGAQFRAMANLSGGGVGRGGEYVMASRPVQPSASALSATSSFYHLPPLPVQPGYPLANGGVAPDRHLVLSDVGPQQQQQHSYPFPISSSLVEAQTEFYSPVGRVTSNSTQQNYQQQRLAAQYAAVDAMSSSAAKSSINQRLKDQSIASSPAPVNIWAKSPASPSSLSYMNVDAQIQKQQLNAIESIRSLAASASSPLIGIPPSPEGLHPFVFQYKSTKYELDHCLALLQALNLEIATVKKSAAVLQKMVNEHARILQTAPFELKISPPSPAVNPKDSSASEPAAAEPSAPVAAESKYLPHVVNGTSSDPVDVYLDAFICTRPDLNLRIVKREPPLYLLNNQEAFIAMRDGVVSIRDGLGWTPFNDFIAEATGQAQAQMQKTSSTTKKKKKNTSKKASSKKARSKSALPKKKKKIGTSASASAKKPSASLRTRPTAGGPSTAALLAKKRSANLAVKRLAAQRAAAKKKY